MNHKLRINGKEVSFEDIKNKNYPKELSSYESNTLEFCRQWLNQQEEYTIHTSGSTGVSKSITTNAVRMRTSALMTARAIGLKENDYSLVCLNTEYIGGKMMLVRGLTVGLNMEIIEPVSNPLKPFSSTQHFDFTALVPLQLEAILKETPDKVNILNGMKGILIGGAPVTVELEKESQKITAPVYHTFGMTETLSHIALRKINGKEPENYFKVLEGIHIAVDERNCLIIDSPFSDVPVITNDVVKLLDKDKFIWLGRADFIVNSGGVKIHPEKVEKEVEKILTEKQLPNRFFIAGLPDSRLGQSVTLIVEGNEWDEKFQLEFQSSLSQLLHRFEIPKNVYFISKFTETPTGKIDRSKTVALVGKK